MGFFHLFLRSYLRARRGIDSEGRKICTVEHVRSSCGGPIYSDDSLEEDVTKRCQAFRGANFVCLDLMAIADISMNLARTLRRTHGRVGLLWL